MLRKHSRIWEVVGRHLPLLVAQLDALSDASKWEVG